MTELNLGANSMTIQTTPEQTKHRPSRGRRFACAFLLSLLIPGAGQVYLKRPVRGLAIAVFLFLALFLIGEFPLLVSFQGLMIALLTSLPLRLGIIIDACILAWRRSPPSIGGENWKILIASTIIVFLLSVYPAPDYLLKRWGYFSAYKIASSSMYPTLIEGDRMVASMDAYRTRSPQRGELVIFTLSQLKTIFPKRVAGVAGDIISRGSRNTILVNGTVLRFPEPCGNNHPPRPLAAEGPPFETVEVPEGKLFVIGDNLDDSYDSRYFGFVSFQQIKGKPVFLYWSPDLSRIGCSLR